MPTKVQGGTDVFSFAQLTDPAKEWMEPGMDIPSFGQTIAQVKESFKSASAKTQQISSKSNAQGVMQKQRLDLNNTEKNTDSNNKSKNLDAGSLSKTDQRQLVKNKTVQVTDKTADTQTDYSKDDFISEDLEKAGKELVEKIAKEFGIDSAQVLDAMQILGLEYESLLQIDNLKDLVMTVMGSDDSIDLLTDSGLYDQFKKILEELRNVLEEISNGNGIEVSELSDIISEKILQKHLSDSKEELELASSDNDISFEKALEGMSNKQVVDESGKKTDVKENDQNIDTVVTPDKKDTEEVKNISSDKDFSNKHEELPENARKHQQYLAEKSNNDNVEKIEISQDSNALKMNLQTANPFEQIFTGISEALKENIQSQQIQGNYTGHGVDQSSILKQISDAIKVQIKAEATSMELQLHPASLGSVKVLVQQAQEGGLIARFTAQSDAVKAALESQILSLQQRFDEQGLKVNAVEVTVDAHAFEQNLEQNRQSDAQMQERKNSSSSKNRRINLADLDLSLEDGKELDDDERIAKEMMKANGSTIDYMA
ncbi:flagellar hook-length control protein FliK [Butyrivibrio sp. NC3005]|uniref:flagellar hook-length control protein FliK n=1 Tax=Butyrivibrio sp. NC3005 TaxID=1280685 RepID=UPI00041ADAA6|nr:flagellar hook-length control protein FliK [Butyrivibrio sp. NC3005]